MLACRRTIAADWPRKRPGILLKFGSAEDAFAYFHVAYSPSPCQGCRMLAIGFIAFAGAFPLPSQINPQRLNSLPVATMPRRLVDNAGRIPRAWHISIPRLATPRAKGLHAFCPAAGSRCFALACRGRFAADDPGIASGDRTDQGRSPSFGDPSWHTYRAA